jgi:transposase
MSTCREPNLPYPPSFRRQAVELIRSGTPLKQVADELDVSEQMLRNWRRQGDINAGRAEALNTDERDELRRLQRENFRLTQERGILRERRLSSRGRPIAGDVLPADRREVSTASSFPAVQRARRLARRLLRLQGPSDLAA